MEGGRWPCAVPDPPWGPLVEVLAPSTSAFGRAFKHPRIPSLSVGASSHCRAPAALAAGAWRGRCAVTAAACVATSAADALRGRRAWAAQLPQRRAAPRSVPRPTRAGGRPTPVRLAPLPLDPPTAARCFAWRAVPCSGVWVVSETLPARLPVGLALVCHASASGVRTPSRGGAYGHVCTCRSGGRRGMLDGTSWMR